MEWWNGLIALLIAVMMSVKDIVKELEIMSIIKQRLKARAGNDKKVHALELQCSTLVERLDARDATIKTQEKELRVGKSHGAKRDKIIAEGKEYERKQIIAEYEKSRNKGS